MRARAADRIDGTRGSLRKAAALPRPRPRATLAAAAAALLVLAVACGETARRDEAVRDDVRAAMAAFPTSLSLIGKTDTNSEIIARLVTDSLVQYDATLAPRPRLAESWDLAADGREVTFHLRKGVLWHDGTEVTASDVVFTVRKVREPATEARSAIGQFESVESIEAPDPATVRVRFKEPCADPLDPFTLPIVPEHVAGKDPDILTGRFAEHPVGCGPFRFVRAVPGREIVLEANPAYWDGAPSLRRITFTVLPDERTAYGALLRGDLDLLGVTPDVFRDAATNPQAARLRRFHYFMMSTWYVGWNGDGSNPFFTDPSVRRAIVLALDRPAFIGAVLGGLARPAVGTYHPDSAWANRSLEPWAYDPAEAARLLDAAGWRMRPGGTRARDGVPFSFTLTVPAGSQEITDRIAAWFQESVRKIGVEVSIEKLEWRTFLDRRRAGKFDAVMARLNLSPSPDQFELYHSSSRGRGMNFMGLADAETDRLLEEGRRTVDPAARRKIYDRLQVRLHELEPLSCLFGFAAPVLVDRRLEGVEPSPLGLWTVLPGPRAWRWRR